jgi:hypothetical protein
MVLIYRLSTVAEAANRNYNRCCASWVPSNSSQSTWPQYYLGNREQVRSQGSHERINYTDRLKCAQKPLSGQLSHYKVTGYSMP